MSDIDPKTLPAIVRAYLYASTAYVHNQDSNPETRRATHEYYRVILHELVWGDDWTLAKQVDDFLEALGELFVIAGTPLTSA
jgi:hypothetical protein